MPPNTLSHREHGARDAAPRFPFPSLPKGWFAVAFSDDLAVGDVSRLRYFGRDLIAFRGASGRAHVTGAYCPHLGAHLGHGGRVEGDTIRCPFHGWRFDGDGRCAAIPYCEHVPPRAQLDAYPTLEQDGVIHVFFDPEGGAPWELPALDGEGWTPGRTVLWRGLKTHPQEVFENTVDMAHIGPVHDGRRARLIGPPRRESERMIVDLEFEAPGDIVGMPGQINDVHLSVTMVGLGWVGVETHVRNVDVRARQRILVTPIDEETVDIRGIVHLRETDDPAFTEELARIFYDAYVEDFAKDFPIWENKRYLQRPRIAKGDGPIGTYRKWCEQFYVERADVAPAHRSVGATDARPDLPLAALRASASRALSPLSTRVRSLLGALPPSIRGWDATKNVAPRSNGAAKKAGNGAASASASSASAQGSSSASAQGSSSALGSTDGADHAAPTTSQPVASAREYRESLPERFVPEAASGVDAVFQWELGGEGGETFHARVRDGQLEVAPGSHPRPTTTLVMSAADYVRVINGELDGMTAFTSGRGKVVGNLRMAMKMRRLFPA